MQFILSVLAFLLFIGLVLVHEWGHFIMARKSGVEVEEFGLGFPPRAWGKKTKSGMLLSLNWLPLGGFVKMKGEHDSDNRPGSFGAASLGAKTKIMLAGVTMNLIVALLLFTVLALIGMPKLISQQNIGQEQFTVASDTKVVHKELRTSANISDNSPAKRSGLQPGDKIVAVRCVSGSCAGQVQNVDSSDALHNTSVAFAGQKVQLQVLRKGKSLELTPVNIRTKAEVEASKTKQSPSGIGYFGFEPVNMETLRSTWSAPIVALGLTKQLIILTFQGLGHALSGLGSAIAGIVSGNHAAREKGQTQASEQVGGPIAIFKVLWTSGDLGVNFMLAIIAVISLTLAIMNILPIPALDGGRLFMMLGSRGILKRPLSQVAEERIVGAGMAVLLLLMVLITFVDIQRFF